MQSINKFSPHQLKAAADTKLMGMVAEQTKEWTELMSKQRKDNWEMIKAHRTAQEEILRKIMETAQVWPQILASEELTGTNFSTWSLSSLLPKSSFL